MTVKRLGPGMYEKDGELHILSDELAHAAGVPVEWLEVEGRLERLIRIALEELGADTTDLVYEETEELPSWVGFG